MVSEAEAGVRPIGVVDLDALLEPMPAAKKQSVGFERALRGKTADPVWLSPSSAATLRWLSETTELILLTQRLSVELIGSRLPPFCRAVVAGGFTIQDQDGVSDLTWREESAYRAAADFEAHQAVLSDARSALGERALLLSAIEQDGLPYAISVPITCPAREDVLGFLEGHQLLSGHERAERLSASIFRRREIGFAHALEHIRSTDPDLADRPAVAMNLLLRGAPPLESGEAQAA